MEEKEMKTEFDFQQVGRRTPYRVPEGFFETFTRQVQAEAQRRRRRCRVRLWLSAASVAAVAAVVCAFLLPAFPDHDGVVEPSGTHAPMLAGGKVAAPATAPDAPVFRAAASPQAVMPAPAVAAVAGEPAAQPAEPEAGSEFSDLSDDLLTEMVSMMQADPFLLASGEYAADYADALMAAE